MGCQRKRYPRRLEGRNCQTKKNKVRSKMKVQSRNHRQKGKKVSLKETKTPKKVVSDEEMETDEVETKPSPEKVKKPISNFFTPKSASNKKTKIPTPEVKNDPVTPVAAKP